MCLLLGVCCCCWFGVGGRGGGRINSSVGRKEGEEKCESKGDCNVLVVYQWIAPASVVVGVHVPIYFGRKGKEKNN